MIHGCLSCVAQFFEGSWILTELMCCSAIFSFEDEFVALGFLDKPSAAFELPGGYRRMQLYDCNLRNHL